MSLGRNNSNSSTPIGSPDKKKGKGKDTSSTPLLSPNVTTPTHTTYGEKTDKQTLQGRKSVVNELSLKLGSNSSSPSSSSNYQSSDEFDESKEKRVVVNVNKGKRNVGLTDEQIQTKLRGLPLREFIDEKETYTPETLESIIKGLQEAIIQDDEEIHNLLYQESRLHFYFRLFCDYVIKPEYAIAAGAFAYEWIYSEDHTKVEDAINANNPSLPQEVAIDSGAQALTTNDFIPVIQWVMLAFVLTALYVTFHNRSADELELKLKRIKERRDTRVNTVLMLIGELGLIYTQDSTNAISRKFDISAAMAGTMAQRNNNSSSNSSSSSYSIDPFSMIEYKTEQAIANAKSELTSNMTQSHNTIMKKLKEMEQALSQASHSHPRITSSHNNMNDSIVDDEENDSSEHIQRLTGSSHANSDLLTTPQQTNRKTTYTSNLPVSNNKNNKNNKNNNNNNNNNSFVPGPSLLHPISSSSSSPSPSHLHPSNMKFTLAQQQFGAVHSPRSQNVINNAVENIETTQFRTGINKLLPKLENAKPLIDSINAQYGLANEDKSNNEALNGLASIIPAMKPTVKFNELTENHVLGGLSLLLLARNPLQANFSDTVAMLSRHTSHYDAANCSGYANNTMDAASIVQVENRIKNKQLDLVEADKKAQSHQNTGYRRQ